MEHYIGLRVYQFRQYDDGDAQHYHFAHAYEDILTCDEYQ
jgi:hypothetical protein